MLLNNNHLSWFRSFAVQPLSYDESISYLEYLGKLHNHINVICDNFNVFMKQFDNHFGRLEKALVNHINCEIEQAVKKINTDYTAILEQVNTLTNVTLPNVQQQLAQEIIDRQTADDLINNHLGSIDGSITALLSDIDAINNVTIPNLQNQITTNLNNQNTINTNTNTILDEHTLSINTINTKLTQLQTLVNTNNDTITARVSHIETILGTLDPSLPFPDIADDLLNIYQRLDVIDGINSTQSNNILANTNAITNIQNKVNNITVFTGIVTVSSNDPNYIHNCPYLLYGFGTYYYILIFSSNPYTSDGTPSIIKFDDTSINGNYMVQFFPDVSSEYLSSISMQNIQNMFANIVNGVLEYTNTGISFLTLDGSNYDPKNNDILYYNNLNGFFENSSLNSLLKLIGASALNGVDGSGLVNLPSSFQITHLYSDTQFSSIISDAFLIEFSNSFLIVTYDMSVLSFYTQKNISTKTTNILVLPNNTISDSAFISILINRYTQPDITAVTNGYLASISQPNLQRRNIPYTQGITMNDLELLMYSNSMGGFVNKSINGILTSSGSGVLNGVDGSGLINLPKITLSDVLVLHLSVVTSDNITHSVVMPFDFYIGAFNASNGNCAVIMKPNKTLIVSNSSSNISSISARVIETLTPMNNPSPNIDINNTYLAQIIKNKVINSTLADGTYTNAIYFTLSFVVQSFGTNFMSQLWYVENITNFSAFSYTKSGNSVSIAPSVRQLQPSLMYDRSYNSVSSITLNTGDEVFASSK